MHITQFTPRHGRIDLPITYLITVETSPALHTEVLASCILSQLCNLIRMKIMVSHKHHNIFITFLSLQL